MTARDRTPHAEQTACRGLGIVAHCALICVVVPACTLDFDAPFAETPTSDAADAYATPHSDAADVVGEWPLAPDAADATPDGSDGEPVVDADASDDAQADAVGDAPEDMDTGPCGANAKLCEATCVPLDDPAYGCAPDSCSPCALPNTAQHGCAAGACVALSCSNDPYAWGDCDSVASNGCEQQLVSNNLHCGACNSPCGPMQTCEGLTCVCSAPLSLCGSTCVDTSDDLANCGGCGQVCGGVCVQGKCEPRVLADADMPSSLALTDVDVYWTSNVSQGRVARVSKSGGASSTFASSENYPDLIVIQGGDALWARDETRLLIKPLASGFTSTLAPNENWIRGLVADGDVAYWTTGSSVHLVELVGSAVYSLYPPGLTNAHGIASDGTFLYVGSDDCVWRIMPGSYDVEFVAQGFQDVSDIEVSGSTVYWVSSNENCDQVFTAPKTGGDPTDPTMLLDCTDGPATIAVDGVHVYVALESEGVVQRIPVQGGSAETLASDQVNPTAIVVDDSAVYWANCSDTNGAILALTK